MLIRRLAIAYYLATFTFVSLVDAQSVAPSAPLPQAIYSPAPVYRQEWAKQGLAGKGVVLVTIDPKTGKVSGVRMLQSTGSSQLDGAALQAYSQWRFRPGSVTQVKMPITFANRQAAQTPVRSARPPPASYYLLILFGLVVFATAFFRRRKR